MGAARATLTINREVPVHVNKADRVLFVVQTPPGMRAVAAYSDQMGHFQYIHYFVCIIYIAIRTYDLYDEFSCLYREIR